MFVVYKLFFSSSDKVYIGKTYDITKRIIDHNYTVFVLNEQTHKGNWIRKHSKNCELQYEILFETDDEQVAYDKELEVIKDYLNKGIPIVNTQRVREAGGRRARRTLSSKSKNSMRKRFGKEYVLLGKNGGEVHISCLSEFSENNNLSYKSLNSCARGNSFISQGYKVLYKDQWDSLSEEGKVELKKKVVQYNPRKTDAIKTYHENKKKEFWLLNKDGTIEHGFGAEAYFNKMGYSSGNIFNSLRKRRPQYGKMLFYNIEDMEYFKKHEMHKFLYTLNEVEKWLIFDEVSTTKYKSRERGDKVRELSKKYFCSYRKIADIYKEYKNKTR